jgi:hypothetical protein
MDLGPAFQGLDDRDRIYVESRLRGMSQVAAAAAAGLAPANASRFEQQPHIKDALDHGRRISAIETGITRLRISDMLLDAYRSATTAAEMVMAARELGRLHGLYAPQKVELDHTHKLAQVKSAEDIRRMPTAELMQLVSARGEDVIDGQFELLPAPRMADVQVKENS